MKYVNTVILASVAGLSILLPHPGMAATADDAQQSSSTSDEPETRAIQEIVVTAQKREESLQSVPIAITAVSAETMTANRINGLTDMGSIAPNVVIKAANPGLQQVQTVIRGNVSNPAVPGAQRGISYYLDGVYLGNNSAAIYDIVDLQRIEVLKGPQGTLFGRNATGGAVSLITANPAGEFRVKQDLTYGNYNQFRSKTRIDLPQMGALSAAITFVHSERDGDTRNLGAGTVWDFTLVNPSLGKVTSPKRLGDQNLNGFSVALRVVPTDGLDIVYKFDFAHNDYTPGATGSLDSNMTGRALATLINFQSAAVKATLTPFGTKRPKAVNNWFTGPAAEKNWGHNLTATYALTDEISIKDVFGARKAQNRAQVQNDGLGGLYNIDPRVPAGTPFLFFGTDNDYHQSQLSNEFQVNVDTTPVYFTGGYIYYTEKTTTSYSGGIAVVSTAGQTGLGCSGLVTRNSTNPVTFVLPASFDCQPPALTKSQSQAVYGQAEIHVTPEIDLIGGLRQTWDKNAITDNVPTLGYVKSENKNNKLTYLLGANYKPSSDILLYVKYGTGFISGGTYKNYDYKPETSTSYEAGLKAEWFGRTLRTNIALFHVVYDDLQTSIAAPVIHIENAGKARAQGFEFEGTLLPIDGLTLNGSVGYTDFKYLKLSPDNQAIVDAGKIFVPLARPKWTSSLAAQYETPEMSWGGKFSIRADAQYQSASHLNATPVDAAQLKTTTVSSTWLVNGRVALSEIPLAGGKAQVALWARNLLNNDDLTFLFNLSPAAALGAIYQPARTYGLDVSFSF